MGCGVKPVKQFVAPNLAGFPDTNHVNPILELGDMCIAEDTGRVYICTSLSPVGWTWFGNPDVTVPSAGDIDGGSASTTYDVIFDGGGANG